MKLFRHFIIVAGLILLNASIFSQEVFLSLPLYLEQLDDDFYINQVFDRRDYQEDIGFIDNTKKETKSPIILKNGLIPEMTAYFNHMLVADTGKIPVTVIVKQIIINEEIKDTIVLGEVEVSLDFFLEKNGALARVHKSESQVSAPISNHEVGLSILLAVGINECLKDFSQSNWRNHSFLTIRERPVLIDEAETVISDKDLQSAKKGLQEMIKSDIFFSKFRISLEGGYAYWYLDIPDGSDLNIPEYEIDDYQDYIRGLRPGYDMAFDFSYFPGSNYGVGVKLSTIRTWNKFQGYEVYNDDTLLLSGDLQETVNIRYLGLMATGRLFLSNYKILLSGYISAGWLWFSDDYSYLPYESYLIKGDNYGINVGAGAEFVTGKSTAIGISFNYYYGNIDEVSILGYTIPLSDRINLNHFTVNLAMRLYR